MIISKTPFRLSFFGGGTDFPIWYRENPGAVLATSIDKYCYISCRYLPPFFGHRHRIVWSQIELAHDVSEIRHPAVRETLKFMKIPEGIELHHAADLPAQTGMGTSSAFTVGLLNALHTLKGIKLSKMELALEAIHIEQNLIKETVGSQDQVTSSFGGFNHIDFIGNQIKVTPIESKRIIELQEYLLLVFTGFSRIASSIEAEKIERIPQNVSALRELFEMVSEGEKILTGNSDLKDFGLLLDNAWRVKRSLSARTSTGYIDFLYQRALEAGAVGGKLLGAGGGGFLLLFVEPEAKPKVRESLKLLEVPFRFGTEGSSIIYQGS